MALVFAGLGPGRTGLPAIARAPGPLADRLEVYTLGLHPDAELHPKGVRVIAQRRQAGWKPIGVGLPHPDTGREIPRIASRSVPPGIHHEELDAEIRGGIHLMDHRRFVDVGPVSEPGVVRDQGAVAPPVPDSAVDEHPRGLPDTLRGVVGEADIAMRRVQRRRANGWY